MLQCEAFKGRRGWLHYCILQSINKAVIRLTKYKPRWVLATETRAYGGTFEFLSLDLHYLRKGGETSTGQRVEIYTRQGVDSLDFTTEALSC